MLSPSVIVVFIIICLFLMFGLVVFFGAPYVPSHQKDVKKALAHFNIGNADLLVDIGSGDGRVLRLASRLGAHAVGYEINPILVVISRLLSFRDRRVRVMFRNVWFAKLPHNTTIVYAFSVLRDEKKLTMFLQREANRLDRSLKLLCYASPLKNMVAVDTFEAYHLYIFYPLQSKKA